MKEKLCDENLSPYFQAKYLPQSQCGTFQVEANTMNPHPISCPQCTFEQCTFRQGKELKDLSEKLMKGVQDLIAQMKQMKIQTDSIGKPKIIDHNEIIAAPIEDNSDDDILVEEKPQVTPNPNVDKDVHAMTSVANESAFDQPSKVHEDR